MHLASTVDFLWVWEQISKLNHLLKEIVEMFLQHIMRYDLTYCGIQYSCSLSGTIGHFLKNTHYYNYTVPKVSNWFYRSCLDRLYPPSMAKQRSSSGPCSSLTARLSYSVSTKPTYAAFANENILNWLPSPMSGSATWCGLPLPDLLGYDRILGCWMQPLLFRTLILQRSKVDASFFCIALLFAKLTSYARQWLKWKYEDHTVCLISKQIGAVKTQYKKPSFFVFCKKN